LFPPPRPNTMMTARRRHPRRGRLALARAGWQLSRSGRGPTEALLRDRRARAGVRPASRKASNAGAGGGYVAACVRARAVRCAPRDRASRVPFERPPGARHFR